MSEMQKNSRGIYIYGIEDEKSAYTVQNYPWGFTTKTLARFWIESANKKRGGQRFVKQTFHPHKEIWCKPKKSVYYPVMVMFISKEKGHVGFETLSEHGLGCDEEGKRIEEFAETHKGYLTEFQKNQVKMIHSWNEVLKNVKCTVKVSTHGPVNVFSDDPAEKEKMSLMLRDEDERKKKNEETYKKLNHAVAHAYKTNKVCG